MTQGPGRFEFFLIKLEELIQQAVKTENPAFYLYKNDARTILFMLEGLSKLYAGLHNKKKFTYAKEYFKSLEDLLGNIDHYDAYSKIFLEDPLMPVTLRLYMERKREEQIALMNETLKKDKWINYYPSRTQKIRKKIKEADWKSPVKELQLIEDFYEDEIEEINFFYEDTEGDFTEIEEEVHELRRQLRWLSIYPQALRGAIQLTDNGVPDEFVKKYLTEKIVNSPYNVMPAKGNNKTVLIFEKNYFLALSNIIDQLGDLKDKGLGIFATAEAIKNTQFVSDEIAMQKACELHEHEQNPIQNILTQASFICRSFFDENNLGKMVIGVSS